MYECWCLLKTFTLNWIRSQETKTHNYWHFYLDAVVILSFALRTFWAIVKMYKHNQSKTRVIAFLIFFWWGHVCDFKTITKKNIHRVFVVVNYSDDMKFPPQFSYLSGNMSKCYWHEITTWKKNDIPRLNVRISWHEKK